MFDITRGVKGYVYAKAVVEITFPVDFHDRADISCYQCKYYRRNYRSCGLNGEICEYPDKYIGSRCPLIFYTEEEQSE